MPELAVQSYPLYRNLYRPHCSGGDWGPVQPTKSSPPGRGQLEPPPNCECWVESSPMTIWSFASGKGSRVLIRGFLSSPCWLAPDWIFHRELYGLPSPQCFRYPVCSCLVAHLCLRQASSPPGRQRKEGRQLWRTTEKVLALAVQWPLSLFKGASPGNLKWGL